MICVSESMPHRAMIPDIVDPTICGDIVPMELLCDAKARVGVRSTEYTEAHFDAKAARYQAALRLAPHARTLELLPFLFLLNDRLSHPPKKQTAADLLCGSGFLTSALAGCFRRVVGIDVSGGMLTSFPSESGVAHIKAALDEQPAVLADKVKPNAIVALAGLHHLYETVNGSVDRPTSDTLQSDAVLDWASSLPDDGVAVIADVTDPAMVVEYSSTASPIRCRHPVLTERFDRLSAALAESIRLPSTHAIGIPASLDRYLDDALRFSPTAKLPSPGNWFRNVVAEHGLYGHIDNFLNPHKLASAVHEGGYSVDYFELPTPWIFSSDSAFLLFFYDKFAFGPPVSTAHEIPASIVRLIQTQADRYLGLRALPNGAVAVGWRLGYYVISRG